MTVCESMDCGDNYNATMCEYTGGGPGSCDGTTNCYWTKRNRDWVSSPPLSWSSESSSYFEFGSIQPHPKYKCFT